MLLLIGRCNAINVSIFLHGFQHDGNNYLALIVEMLIIVIQKKSVKR